MGILFTHSINTTIALMFMAGFANSGRCSVGFLYLSEFLTPEWIIPIATIYNMSDGGLTYFDMTLYFDVVSKDYFWFCQLGVWFTLISIIAVNAYLPESPLWLIKTG